MDASLLSDRSNEGSSLLLFESTASYQRHPRSRLSDSILYPRIPFAKRTLITAKSAVGLNNLNDEAVGSGIEIESGFYPVIGGSGVDI